jgi:hypothetical protein
MVKNARQAEEVRKKRKSKWLYDKWGGLFVVLAADGDDPEVTGTIYGFEWNEQAGCQVCTVEDTTDILTPVNNNNNKLPGLLIPLKAIYRSCDLRVISISG